MQHYRSYQLLYIKRTGLKRESAKKLSQASVWGMHKTRTVLRSNRVEKFLSKRQKLSCMSMRYYSNSSQRFSDNWR